MHQAAARSAAARETGPARAAVEALDEMDDEGERGHETAVLREVREEHRVVIIAAERRLELRPPGVEEPLSLGREAEERTLRRGQFLGLDGGQIERAFPTWAKTQPHYADLSLDNVVVVTLPQPIVVQMVRTGAVALGNLTIDFTRASGFYPDIVMGGPAPLRELHKLGVLQPQARYFSRNRGRALLVRKGNPLGIRGLADVARTGARVAQADSVEASARAGNRAAIEALIGKLAADAFFANEVEHFPGRLGITHRDVPEMVARGYADVGLTQYHLISYWARTFPNQFELVPIAGAERFPVKIAFGRVIGPLRPQAAKAFEEFFFSHAKDVYPRYDFAQMTDGEYGAVLALE